ncbi:MAG TPA: Ig-like domain-containing protein, partial [Candidatus Limnocylindrales bacterium]
TIGVRIQDNGGSSNGGVDISGEQTFTITITNVDDPPNAVNDLHVPIGENAPATAIDVLANDTYLPDPVETLGITAVTQGAHGTVVITGSNGVGGTGLTYRPAAGYYGSDQFTYTIQDSGGVATDQGTVQVDIAKDVTAPVFTSMGQSLRQNVSMVTALPIKIAWVANDGTGVGIKSYLFQRSIDGGSYTTITLSTLLTTSYSSSVTAGHTYRYRVRATDKNGNVSAFKYTVAFKGTIYQDTSSLAVYSGTWGTATSSTSYIGGTTHYAGTAGKSVQITTTMRDVAFVGPISATRGTASIYVDNVLIATTLNETSATTFYKRVIWATHFASVGTHTIRFVVTGPARIDLDCFLILR